MFILKKIRTNPKITVSPYIFNKKDSNNDLNESVYEDCKSANIENNYKRLNTKTSLYEDCVEIQPNNNGKAKEKSKLFNKKEMTPIPRKFKLNTNSIDSSNAGISKLNKKGKRVILQTNMEFTTKNTCCNINSVCLII